MVHFGLSLSRQKIDGSDVKDAIFAFERNASKLMDQQSTLEHSRFDDLRGKLSMMNLGLQLEIPARGSHTDYSSSTWRDLATSN